MLVGIFNSWHQGSRYPYLRVVISISMITPSMVVLMSFQHLKCDVYIIWLIAEKGWNF